MHEQILLSCEALVKVIDLLLRALEGNDSR